MANGLYKVLTPYSLNVACNDISGTKPSSVLVGSGLTFVGDSAEVGIVNLLAKGAIALLSSDPLQLLQTANLQGGLTVGSLPPLVGAANRKVVAYPKESVGAPLTHLSGTGTGARVALITATVTEAFTDAAQPTFTINKTGSANYFAASTIFTGAPLGKVFVFGGFLAATNDITVTAVAATGVGTGALLIESLVLPASL